jgi:hypothetical protein
MLKKYLSIRTITSMFKFNFKSYRKLGFDRYDYPDKKRRTGLEINLYKPQFVLTEEEKLGISILI